MSGDRVQFWAWLAHELGLSEPDGDNLGSLAHTLYLATKDIQRQASLANDLIVKYIARNGDHGRDRTVFIDLSANDYFLLREPVLYHVGKAALAVTIQGLASTTVILLPGMPPEGSLLWHALSSYPQSPVLVISGDGRHRSECEQVHAPSSPSFSAECKRKMKELLPNSAKLLQQKLVRRLGHFERPNEDDVCSRYFWDGSLAISEIATLMLKKILFDVKQGHIIMPDLIAMHAPMSRWMLEVVLALAEDLNIQDRPILDVSTGVPEGLSMRGDEHVVLVSDLVHTGTAIQQAVGRLQSIAARPEPIVYTAMSSGLRELPTELGTLMIRPLRNVSPVIYQRKDCPLCRLEVPRYSHDEEQYFHVPSYDFWEMLNAHSWSPEVPVSPAAKGFDLAPDLELLFGTVEYKAWIAFKYWDMIHRMSQRGGPADYAVVYPDERPASILLDSLRALFQNRLTAVPLPREIIGKSRADVIELASRMSAENGGEPAIWLMQLEHLEAKGIGVIVIDGFNASGRTFREVMSTLRSFNIEVLAYMPFWDRAPGAILDTRVPVHSLYEFWSPRADFVQAG